MLMAPDDAVIYSDVVHRISSVNGGLWNFKTSNDARTLQCGLYLVCYLIQQRGVAYILSAILRVVTEELSCLIGM